MFGISYSDDCVNFFNKLLFLLILFKEYLVYIVTLPFTIYTIYLKVHVPLGQPGLASSVLDHNKLDTHL